MKTYRKLATVQAKIFEPGDEDGCYGSVPFIKTLEQQTFYGKYYEHYLCVGIDGERWLVEKDIFQRTYELVSDYEELIHNGDDE